MNNKDSKNRIQQLELLMFDQERDSGSIVFNHEALKAKEAELFRTALALHAAKADKRKNRRSELIGVFGSAACLVLIAAASFMFALRGLPSSSLDAEPVVFAVLSTPTKDELIGSGSDAIDPSSPEANLLTPSTSTGSSNEPHLYFPTWSNEDPLPASGDLSSSDDPAETMSLHASEILYETMHALSHSDVADYSDKVSLYVSEDYELSSKIRTDVSLNSVSYSYQYKLDTGYANITYDYHSSDNSCAASPPDDMLYCKPEFMKLSGGECVAIYSSDDGSRTVAVLKDDTYNMTISFKGVSADDALTFLSGLKSISLR